MQNDYLLISVDSQKKFAIRFLSLAHTVEQALNLQNPGFSLRRPFAEFLIGSSLLGSRQDDQESSLFKLHIHDDDLKINCEVASRGPMRTAIFPAERKELKQKYFQGELKVVRLKTGGSDIYESVVQIKNSSIQETLNHYLVISVQSDSLLLIHADTLDFRNNFGLWIERLPDTSQADWLQFSQRLQDGLVFQESFSQSNDPDIIIQKLFPEPIQILAVTKPRLTCSCSRERIISGLAILPQEEIVEIFMDNKGVETRCDYCQKVWKITDTEIKELLHVKNTLH